ncbi:hypothetical protein OC842_006150 [Tilletia horrida]|uniref:Major facilitator superfamily (MFS) profile domain-containing protein n=1 Tax=Tilletia horrida TaxID=155126 RepID=A0AAN6G6F5_9BASI|nr:hypothetical protein OC842_006150 [Tilletia horrida]
MADVGRKRDPARASNAHSFDDDDDDDAAVERLALLTPDERAKGGPALATDGVGNDEHGKAARGRKDGGDVAAALAADEHVIPPNNMRIVLPGLLLTIFLAALDQTIVASALPSIAGSLPSKPSNYAWVGSAYLLTSTALTPCYGRLSDLTGRKPLLWISIAIFLLGSMMCGLAPTMAFLILSRGVQGVGGGGILALVNILVADLVELSKRASVMGMIGVCWGVASVMGPLAGGALADTIGWRWCFLINLPFGSVAFWILYKHLNLNPTKPRTLSDLAREFDIVGLLLIVVSLVLVLLGFEEASRRGWQTMGTVLRLGVGLVGFVLFGWWELRTDRRPIVPPRLFQTPSTVLMLFACFAQSVPFFGTTYYAPIFFQAVSGASPTMSGVQLLPFSLLSSAINVLTGFLVVRLKGYRLLMWFGFTIMTLGYVLLAALLKPESAVLVQEGILAIAALGMGCLFQTPLIGLMAAMPQSEVGATTATLAVTRVLSGTVGVAISGAIFTASVRTRLRSIPEYTPPSTEGSATDLRGLGAIQPPELARRVVGAYSDALRDVWRAYVPLLVFGLVGSFFIKAYSLKRPTARAPAAAPGATSGASRSEGQDAGSQA